MASIAYGKPQRERLFHKEFDPSQPRDEDGKWTDGGTSGSVSSSIPKDTVGTVTGRQPWKHPVVGLVAAGVGTAAGTYLLLRRGDAPLILNKITQLTSGRPLTIYGDGAHNVELAMRQAISAMPAAHYKALQEQGVRFVAVKNLGAYKAHLKGPEKGMLHAYGFFDRRANVLLVAGATGKDIHSPGLLKAVFLHESAHALDFRSGVRGLLSNNIKNSINRELRQLDYETSNKIGTYLLGSYGFRGGVHRKEILANVYAAKYSGYNEPVYLGGLTRDQVLRAFPVTSKRLDLVDPLEFKPGYINRSFAEGVRRSFTQHEIENPGLYTALGLPPLASKKGFYFDKFDPSQPRDEDGKWTDTGGGGGAAAATKPKGRAAAIAGATAGAALALGLGALALRNPAAVQALARNAARQAGLGGTAVAGGGRTVSRSLIEGSIYNVTGLHSTFGLRPLRNQLASRFKGMNTHIGFGRDSEGTKGIGIMIRNKGKMPTAAQIQSGKVPTNMFVADMMLHKSEAYGTALKINNLYAPDTAAGHLFTREVLGQTMRVAVANKVDNIHTFAGSSMGGFYWPQRGFELGNPNGTMGRQLRSLVSKRAGELLDAKVINEATYKELATIVGKQWDKDTPTRLAHMSSKLNLPKNVKLTEFPSHDLIRGEMTLGKALLSGTQGFYELPKVKYEQLMTITKAATPPSPFGSFQPKPKRKKTRAGRVSLTAASNISTAPAGVSKQSTALTFSQVLEKYDPDQPRDENGQWTSGGGGSSRGGGGFDGDAGSTSRSRRSRGGNVKQTNRVIINVSPSGRATLGGGGGGRDDDDDPSPSGGWAPNASLDTRHEVAPGVSFSSSQTGRAALIGAGLAVAAGMLARNPKMLQQGYNALRNMIGGVVTQAPKTPGGRPNIIYTIRPRGGKAPTKPTTPQTAKPAAPIVTPPPVKTPTPTKPLHTMSRTQQNKYRDAVMQRTMAANPGMSEAKAKVMASQVLRRKVAESAAAAERAKLRGSVSQLGENVRSKTRTDAKPKAKKPKATKPAGPGLSTLATIGATLGGAAGAAVRNPVARTAAGGGAAGAASGVLVPTRGTTPPSTVTPSELVAGAGGVDVPVNLSLKDQAKFVDTVNQVKAINTRLQQLAAQQARVDARYPRNRGPGSSYNTESASIRIQQSRASRERDDLLDLLDRLRGRTTKRDVTKAGFNWGPAYSALRALGIGAAGLGATAGGLGIARGFYEREAQRLKDMLPDELEDPNLPQHLKDAIRNRQEFSWGIQKEVNADRTAQTFEEAMSLDKEGKKKTGKTFTKENSFRNVDGKFTTAPGGSAPTTRGVPLLVRGQEAVDLLRRNLKGHPTPTTREFVDKLPVQHRTYLRTKLAALNDLPATDALVSEGGFKNELGLWVPQRQRLHETAINLRIASALTKARPKVGEPPCLVLVGGRPGSGKTTCIEKSGLVPDKDKYLYVNSDDLRGDNEHFIPKQGLSHQDKRYGLPGYAGWNSVLYHKEASELAKRLTMTGLARGLNILHDATMRSPQATMTLIEAAKRCGYKIKGCFVHARPVVAARRALDRAVSYPNGRFVPGYLLGNTVNEETFDATKHLMDEWCLYDVNGKEPKLVAKGTKLTTQDPHPHLWNKHFPEVVKQRTRLFDKAGNWDEDKHPRDEEGKFTSAGRTALAGVAGAALGTVGTLALLRAGQAARVANRAARMRDARTARFHEAETARLDARLARHMEPQGPVSRSLLRASQAMERGSERAARSTPGKKIRVKYRRTVPKKWRERLREFSRPGVDPSGGGKFPGDWFS